MTQEKSRKKKFTRIILGYPFALATVAVAANVMIFGVNPVTVSPPSTSIVGALVVSALLLLLNHTWLMTSTELTRLKYNMHATPEEWEASEHRLCDVPDQGFQEIERHHNAHANATENTVHFVFLALLISVISPTTLAAQVWIIGFAVGRLAHAFFYLTGKDGARGIAMSISLVSLYGLASYLAVSVVI